MFKELLLNVDNIESAINDYFDEKYSDYKVTLNEKKTKPNNKVYDVNFDGRALFLSVFINKQGKITLKVKEGKEQGEKELLATYIVNSHKCKLTGDTKNKSISFNNIESDDFKNVMSIIEEEWCTSCTITEDNNIKLSYRIIGRYRDGLTVNYFKTTNKVNLQGLPLEVFNYTSSFFNELLDIDEVINTMNEVCDNNIEVDSIEQKYVNLMPNSHDKHNDKLKKSLIKSVYNLEVICQDLTCTELIFEPLRALEGHIIITLSQDCNVIKPYINNLSMFTFDRENDIVSFRKNSDEEKVRVKNNKVDYYKKAYKHIDKYRNRYFHWDWHEDLGQDLTLHLDDVRIAKGIILDTLKLIDEYYI
ncbi:type II toxin-antitoxin system RnlA family toxin [Clostridium botulinum]|uniref:type II toxin-antitoxin system RnlA family toxin n=1 Tax=Clostridium botulinum TaxID=1491 RepID=UPI00037DD339|nr:type II toxin-antitoxin system RnlA family toxin [Clostridium botulinum]